MSTPAPSHARVPARVGLVGNPSDGFGGAVVAAPLDELAAVVTVSTPADHRRVSGITVRNDQLGTAAWSTTAAFLADVDTHGHGSPQRIVTAALTTLARHHDGAVPPLEIEWSTTIPRSVGLAGSSAIAIAVIEAVCAHLGWPLDPRITAALALDAEVDELGIAAGWQDRIVQTHRRPVLVDAGTMIAIGGRAVPSVHQIDGIELPIVVGWSSDDAEESGRYHAHLRRRASTPELAGAMDDLAALARHAATHLAARDLAGFAAAVEASWAIRRRALPLSPVHEELVETARATGVAATSPGSGGSVVAVPRTQDETAAVVAALRSRGATAIVASVH